MLFAARRPHLNLSNRSRSNRRGVTLIAVVYFLTGIPVAQPAPVPASLTYPIKEAFDRYVTLTDARNAEELRQGTPFLWVDTLPEATA